MFSNVVVTSLKSCTRFEGFSLHDALDGRSFPSDSSDAFGSISDWLNKSGDRGMRAPRTKTYRQSQSGHECTYGSV